MSHITAAELRAHYGPRNGANKKASASAYVGTGVPTPAQERECDDLQARGESLRASVAWRLYQGKGEILSAITGVPFGALETFVKTGEIDHVHRMILETSAGS